MTLLVSFFGMLTVHVEYVNMEKLTISEVSSPFMATMPNANLNKKAYEQ